MANQVDLSHIVSREFPAVVFVNPIAGGGRANSLLPHIQRVFEARGIPVEFISTANACELESRAREKIAANHRFLLAMGGDGTFQALANAAFGTDTLLGILPAGGGNDLAAALGLPKNPVHAAEILLRGRWRFVDLIRVRASPTESGQASGQERLYVGGGGIGLDAEAARLASGAFRRVPGRLRYVLSALWALRWYAAPRVRVEFPGGAPPPVEARTLLTAVLNTPTYGAGLQLAPDAVVDDGMLDVVFVGDLTVFQVLKLMPRLLYSGELRSPLISRVRAGSLRLIADPPCEFHGDGEILGMTPVEIEVVPAAVQVLAPVVAVTPAAVRVLEPAVE
jgi:diacylglycerol kinase (ATP)